jgi:membrane-associated phospholipid phosphatase
MLIEDLDTNKLTMVNILDILGFYGPLVVIIIVSWALHKHFKYMIVYLFFVVINNSLNRLWKMLFQQQRPANPIPFSKHESYAGPEKYGMPSGHASSIGFSLLFLALVNIKSWWLVFVGFIGILTCVQRWKYRRHTIEQICVGLISGGLFAWIVYVSATKYIMTNIYVTR